MDHPFDLANLIAGDHRLANILFERLERGEGNRQVLVDQMILNVACTPEARSRCSTRRRPKRAGATSWRPTSPLTKW